MCCNILLPKVSPKFTGVPAKFLLPSLQLREERSAVNRCVAQLLFNANQLIVLCHAWSFCVKKYFKSLHRGGRITTPIYLGQILVVVLKFRCPKAGNAEAINDVLGNGLVGGTLCANVRRRRRIGKRHSVSLEWDIEVYPHYRHFAGKMQVGIIL